MKKNLKMTIEQIMESEIPKEHLALATEQEKADLIEYYKRGKTHLGGYSDHDVRYMRLAKEFSTWSKDPSTQIGAVAISKEGSRVLSQGYNGFPRKIKDDHRLYIRKLKYDIVVHAEMNMIYNAVEDGVSLRDSTVYIYGLPCCTACANALIQSGVERVVMLDVKNDVNWTESFKLTRNKFDEAGIAYSLILDKKFLKQGKDKS